jgi:hypothetical protein
MFGPKNKEEAKSYRYNTWAGNPKGNAYNPARCAAVVSGSGQSILSCQCRRRGGHGTDALFCRQHAKG